MGFPRRPAGHPGALTGLVQPQVGDAPPSRKGNSLQAMKERSGRRPQHPSLATDPSPHPPSLSPASPATGESGAELRFGRRARAGDLTAERRIQSRGTRLTRREVPLLHLREAPTPRWGSHRAERYLPVANALLQDFRSRSPRLLGIVVRGGRGRQGACVCLRVRLEVRCDFSGLLTRPVKVHWT